MKSTTIKKAFIDSMPVMAGYIVLGVAFGILLIDKGYSFILAFAMSFFIYAGSMQFVAVNLLTGGASLISSAIMTLMVNARHLFYSISMLSKYKGMGSAKPYLIFSLTDETYALVCNGNPEKTDAKTYYFSVSIFNQCYWVLGSIIGAFIGATIKFNTAGIDFAMTALFIVIFTEQIISNKDRIPAVIGVLSSVVSLLIFGTDKFLIPSMMAIATLLCIYGVISERKKCK